jgi:hypothetical protein
MPSQSVMLGHNKLFRGSSEKEHSARYREGAGSNPAPGPNI